MDRIGSDGSYGRIVVAGLLMRAIISYPICDLRRFSPENTGELNVPTWPNPDENQHFIRAFGKINRRENYYNSGYVAEQHFCNIKRGIRFHSFKELRTKEGKPIQPKVTGRKYYFDGFSVGKLDIEIEYPINETLQINLKAFQEHFSNCILACVRHEGPLTHDEEEKFARFYTNSGRYEIGKAILARTIEQSFFSEFDKLKRFVRVGQPFIVLQSSNQNLELEEDIIELKISSETFSRLTNFDVDFNFGYFQMSHGSRVPVWVLNHGTRVIDRVYHNIPLFMSRLHANHFCFAELLRALYMDIIPYSEPVEEHISKSLKGLFETGKKFRKKGTEFADDSAVTIESIAQAIVVDMGGDQESVLKMVENLGLRNNIRKNVEKVVKKVDATKATITVIAEQGANVMIDKSNTVIGSSGVNITQAGRDAQVNLENSFNAAKSNSKNEDLVRNLETLKSLLNEAIQNESVEDASHIASDYEDFAKETSSPKPRQDKIKSIGGLIVKGIKGTAEIVEPIKKIVTAIIAIF